MTGARRPLRAVIFDVDGTLAETERDGHRVAFNRAFADHDLPYRWDIRAYGSLLTTNGGRQRLEAYLLANGHTPADAARLAGVVHDAKTRHFIEWVRVGPVHSRPGVRELLGGLQEAGIAIAVATTGSRAWVAPLLQRLFTGIPIAAAVTGEDVRRTKPDPEPYERVLALLDLAADEAIAIEDSPAGVVSATGAGLPTLVVTSAYTRSAQFPPQTVRLPGYLAIDQFETPQRAYLRGGVTPMALARLHAESISR